LDISKALMGCELCNATPERIIGNFYILTCRVHEVPMLVLKEHRPVLTKIEKNEAEDIRLKVFPDKKFRGYMQSIPEHWHDHLV